MKEKIVIVGMNHAGTHSAITLASKFKENNEIICFDRNDNISFLGCGMALWIGDVIDSPDGLFYATPESITELGCNLKMRHEVTGVDYENKKITVTNLKTNESFEESYDKLIIGCGSWPILPKSIPGLDLENVHYAKIFQNAQDVIKRLEDETIKNIVVIGAGYIGVELAEAFEMKNKNVKMITDKKVLDGYYDEEFQSEMKDNLAKHMEVLEGESLVSLEGDSNGKVNKVVTDKGEYEADMVLMSLGFLPRTQMFKNDKLDMLPNGAIIVDEHQQSSIKDVYAIGDCSTVFNNASKKNAYIALATNALRTGIVAAYNAAGTEMKMQGVQGSNAISIYKLNLCSTGLTESAAKVHGINTKSVTVKELMKPAFMTHDNHEVKLKIVWEEETKRIIGAQMISYGDISLANHLFSMAIQEEYTIDKLALLDLFFLPHFNQPHNFITKAGLDALEKI